MAFSFVSLHFRLRNLALVTRLGRLFLSFKSPAKPFGQKLLGFGQLNLIKSLSEGQVDNKILNVFSYYF